MSPPTWPRSCHAACGPGTAPSGPRATIVPASMRSPAASPSAPRRRSAARRPARPGRRRPVNEDRPRASLLARPASTAELVPGGAPTTRRPPRMPVPAKSPTLLPRQLASAHLAPVCIPASPVTVSRPAVMPPDELDAPQVALDPHFLVAVARDGRSPLAAPAGCHPEGSASTSARRRPARRSGSGPRPQAAPSAARGG